ncbi:type II toxin-antitoxin system Phd/YefM family antitoxin [Bdellovibrio sp. HCB-162]|uniref:type II toxin-antitoxin system Phd/YefM family antitoxin n=1 Tax=Bdellovibrio sp. HCB-162 TaxID=3394234 RepID=UPI0039BC5AD7
MESTGGTEFRANLKEWLDMADTEVVKVNRPGGKSVVILNAEAYERLMLELVELRGVHKGLLAVAEGRVVRGADVGNSLSTTMSKAKAAARAKHKKVAAG